MECSVLTLPALHIWQIHSFFTAFLVKIFQPQSLPTRRVFYGLPHRLAAKVNNFEIRLTLISFLKLEIALAVITPTTDSHSDNVTLYLPKTDYHHNAKVKMASWKKARKF